MKRKYVCGTNCCVPQCRSSATKDPHLSFHLFPSSKKMVVALYGAEKTPVKVPQRIEWIRLLRIGKEVSDRMCVCSKHFSKNDYFSHIPVHLKSRRILKRNAVPSLCLPVTCPEKKKPKNVTELKDTNKNEDFFNLEEKKFDCQALGNEDV